MTDDDWDFGEIVHVWCKIDTCGWSNELGTTEDPHDAYIEHWRLRHATG